MHSHAMISSWIEEKQAGALKWGSSWLGALVVAASRMTLLLSDLHQKSDTRTERPATMFVLTF